MKGYALLFGWCLQVSTSAAPGASSNNSLAERTPSHAVAPGGELLARDERAVERGFTAYVEDTLVKVRPGGPVQDHPPREAKIEIARDEYEGFQVVVVVGESRINDLSVEVSDLLGPGGATIRASTNIRRFRVGFVHSKSRDPAAAENDWPDPLLPLPGCPDFPPSEASLFDREQAALRILEPQTLAPFWFTIHADAETSAGEYKGSINFVSSKGRLTVPVTVTVWNFNLPKKWSLLSEMWFDDGYGFERHYGSYPSLQEYAAIVNLLDTYRVTSALSILHLGSLLGISIEADGKYSFDFTKIDPWIEVCLKRGNWFNTNLSCNSGWTSQLGGFFGRQNTILDKRSEKVTRFPGGKPLPQMEMIGTRLFDSFWEAYGKHLKEKGWIDKCYVEDIDEPPYEYDDKRNVLLRRFHTAIRELAPGFKLMNWGMNPFSGMHAWAAPFVDVWGPSLNYLPEAASAIKQPNAKKTPLLTYICGSSFQNARGRVPDVYISNPAIDMRIVPWLAYSYGAKGVLYYAGNRWVGDSDKGYVEKDPARRWPATPWKYEKGTGVGWLTYPAPRIKAIYPSIRLENIRDGLEDYEYLARLEQKRRSPVVLTETVFQWPEDPKQLRERRRAIAAEILNSPSDKSGPSPVKVPGEDKN